MQPSPTLTLARNIALPVIGFGTYLIDAADAAGAVESAVIAGYRHIDTAESYGNEDGVGAGVKAGLLAMGSRRDDIFVTSKFWPGNAAWGETVRNYAGVIAGLDNSLLALGLDHVDLYLAHAPSAGAARLDQWRAMLDLQAQGKIRAVGVSNFDQQHIEEITAAGLPLPAANQIELHPWSQKPALVGYLKQNGIQPIAYSSLLPLSTWRAKVGQASSKTDAMRAEDGDASSFAAMAAKYGVSEAQLLLRWGIQMGFAVLPKSLDPQRMRQNRDLFGFYISEADMAFIGTLDRGDGLAWPGVDPTKLG